MTAYITTESGKTVALPEQWSLDAIERVAGIDEDGRIVVDNFDARSEPFVPWSSADMTTYVSHPFIFGLTLCCSASDKGTEDGVVCRGCYGVKSDDAGNYIYKAEDGTFPGLDPKVGWLAQAAATA